MHLSFGMETRNRSTRWDDVRRGPSRQDVLVHTRKLGLYAALARQHSSARN
jgi:hypothetical protein